MSLDALVLAEVGAVELAGYLFGDPLQAVLLLLGNVIMLFSMGLLGYLAAGAFFDALSPESPGRAPSQRE